ncbi:MAG: choice-of-anchor X domain-containing protein [Candidatus Thalassarchaeaceae archaeon]
MTSQKVPALIFIILICSITPMNAFGDDTATERSCEILVDWDVQYSGFDSNMSTELIHRYIVNFEPTYVNGTSPGGVSIQAEHLRNELDILSQEEITFVNAGGVIDIVLNSQPIFNDKIILFVETSETSCTRELSITQWNQPISDHEVTRETTWSMEGGQTDTNQSILFEGRGWQKRTNSLLESNELGNGSLLLDLSDGVRTTTLSLDLSKVWLNESYDGSELITQDFEMLGSGSLILSDSEEGEGLLIEAQVKDAFIVRSWSENTLTERIRIEASGWLSFNGGSNDSSEGGFGEISLFYYETWDENGVRRLQDTQVEANASVRISGFGESFSFELDDFMTSERWEDGIREHQFMKMSGAGNFDFIASESPYIEVNGTIPVIDIESIGGETVSDTIIVDGTYSGDAEGSFGLVREIVDSDAYANESGEYFEADKIRNEFWFNVSATPIGPIDQEFSAEHNLTYEYTVPQEDWDNRILKYEYVEDNGSVQYEYPPNSPTIIQPQPPVSESIFSNPISRETGLCPEILFLGDHFHLIGNLALPLEVSVVDLDIVNIDSHTVSIALWEGNYFNSNNAFGSVVNEGLLAGLLHEVYRTVDFGNGNDSNNESIKFLEYQLTDTILYPSIISSSENSAPIINTSSNSSVRFREGYLFNEGGKANLEILVTDIDTDVVSVIADFSELGLGKIPLSDSGLNGDLVIRDNIWTTEIIHNGLQYGVIEIPIILQDIWTSVTQNITIIVLNEAPRMLSIEFTPSQVFRGEQVSVSIKAVDGHGVDSVSIDMFGNGGGITILELVEELWIGVFNIPEAFTPGERNLIIRLVDSTGESRTTSQIFINGQFKDANRLTILNDSPSVNNITLYRNSQIVSKILIPESGVPISHTLEVTVNDVDDISSAQIKIGRLAPIGSSNSWLLLEDNGNNGDRIANDNIYTISFDVRNTLSEGEFTILIRATDSYLSVTPAESQEHTLFLERGTSNNSEFDNWLSENSMFLISFLMIFLLLIGFGGAYYLLRNSEL